MPSTQGLLSWTLRQSQCPEEIEVDVEPVGEACTVTIPGEHRRIWAEEVDIDVPVFLGVNLPWSSAQQFDHQQG